MRLIGLAIAISGLMYGLMEQHLAMRHLTPLGQQRRWRIIFLTKGLERRESFTDEGWRHWRRVPLALLAWFAGMSLYIFG